MNIVILIIMIHCHQNFIKVFIVIRKRNISKKYLLIIKLNVLILLLNILLKEVAEILRWLAEQVNH